MSRLYVQLKSFMLSSILILTLNSSAQSSVSIRSLSSRVFSTCHACLLALVYHIKDTVVSFREFSLSFFPAILPHRFAMLCTPPPTLVLSLSLAPSSCLSPSSLLSHPCFMLLALSFQLPPLPRFLSLAAGFPSLTLPSLPRSLPR